MENLILINKKIIQKALYTKIKIKEQLKKM